VFRILVKIGGPVSFPPLKGSMNLDDQI
jgi:hypothetical protein